MVGSSSSSTTSERSLEVRSEARAPWLAARGRWRALGGAVLITAFLHRLSAATGLPDTPDALRLIRSLARFDLLELSPHFPGYPLAVALARVTADVSGTGVESGLSWSWLQIGASLLLAPLVACLCVPKERPRARVGAIALLAFHPFLALESLRVGTDFLALPGIFAAILLLRSPDGSWRGATLLGLSLGFRPSLFPWLLALLGAPRKGGAIAGAMIGLLAWILPTAAIVGAETWSTEGARFVTGHFTVWGGSAWTETARESSRVASMLVTWGIEPIAPRSLPSVLRGGLLLAFVLLASAGIGAWRRKSAPSGAPRPHRLRPGPLGWGVLGYAGWILLAQHPDHARHVIPLIPLALGGWVRLAAVRREDRRGDLRGACAGLILALLLTPWTIGLLGDYRASAPPPWTAARALAADPRFDPLLDRVYVADDRAYFTSVGPHWSIGTVFSMAELERDLISLPISPRRVWISSHVGDRRTPVPPAGGDATAPAIIARRDPSLSSYAPETRIELRIESESR